MFLHLKNILTPEEVQTARALLGADAPWVDGRSSAGGQALTQKRNEQLAQDSAPSHELRALVLAALQRDALFFSAALPKKIFNPLFNRYSGESNFYGAHVDGAVLRSKAPEQWVRSDISCTLFLAGTEEYEGGELRIQEAHSERHVKLPAGDMVLYPSSTVHQVAPVTRGARIASFFWIESMVRSTEQRLLLWNMDMDLLKLRSRVGDSDPAVVGLTGTYHNLLRMWADA
ncbi:Fe2+-dependent dioxygenase [Rhodococcus sp. SRB_17]|uniref:Fe2+-dependent dioxygenase n=1 Tax=Acidovorax sp. SRB_24 TaxID=1962700 RepID=UPI00145DB778|nr:Fe2+-dependent dioxygenase [Acidovorax sp. SRB_24]NMM76156.1 Fe2+-dependent dioxygenase [Acidovorax sp. SRB_24]NMM89020.1 Fe2+-dependent dioxygenase [Rhodococcus sp. SRB_17]